jgi:hypothetical protein
VLVLPGWFIERKSPSDVAVLNGNNSSAYFTKLRGEGLTDQLVQRIVHQLDARSRDVEPTTYRPLKA